MTQQASAQDEIEITPEMLEAGVMALNSHTSDEYRVLPDEEIVEEIFNQMFGVSCFAGSGARASSLKV